MGMRQKSSPASLADASSSAGTLFDIGGDEQHIRLDYFTRSDGKTYVQYKVKGNAGTVQV